CARSGFKFSAGSGYQVGRGMVEELVRRGFEVGLHGWTHDAALGFRSTPEIKDALERARDVLGVEKCGFRAPARSYSVRLLEILEELGFLYDGSLPVRSGSAPGTGALRPYRIPGRLLWELPLALQDSEL